jgi:3-carboxy-cis,cis-muconate cycloisomerase
MSLNLEITHGLIFAESASMALASRIGKSAAHTLVEHASRLAIQDKKHLRDVLMADPDFSKHFTAQQTEALFDTRNYLGSADAFIQCVLDDHKKN